MLQKFKLIRGRYKSSRGGDSKFLEIYCLNCGQHLLLYQKDGPGSLKRMYLDRILAPESLTDLHHATKVPNLICTKCNRLIAVYTIYEKEQRKAYGLLVGTIIKKSGKGFYPPETSNILGK